MKSILKKRSAAAVPVVASFATSPALAHAGVGADYRWLTINVFAVIIAITLYVTCLAAKRAEDMWNEA